MNVKYFMEDKTLTFEITEELDHHSCEKIRKRADYEIQRFIPKKVILDFSRVRFMDSAGIGLILGRYNQTTSFGGKLEIVNVNSRTRRVLEMSGILKIIDIVDEDRKIG